MKTLPVIIVALALAFGAFGQTSTTSTTTSTTGATATTSAAAAALPSSWIIGTGVERNTYGITPAWVPFVHIAGCWTGFCEISTIEMPSGAAAATVRQDFGYKMKSTTDHSAMLIAIAGGSLTVTNPSSATLTASLIPSAVTLGGIGGGFAAYADPGLIKWFKVIKGKGVSVWMEFREASVSSVGVKPQFAWAVNYRWK
jgi:hypothetical protein